jgi:3-isopropylmalate/(R)-2-methylmalate dehydratase small subunit
MIKGRAWKYGDDINTDVIYPGRYLDIYEPKEMAKHAMEGLDQEFVERVQKGDVIVAGKNFGSGSSREQAATSLKFSGIGAIVAKSFARIFYRNAINQGIAAIESEDAHEIIGDGDEIEIDLEKGIIKNITRDQSIKIKTLPPFIMDIIRDGGFIENLRKRLPR